MKLRSVELKALGILSRVQWEYAAQIYRVSKATLAGLEQIGLIEIYEQVPNDPRLRYKITDIGRSALDNQSPKEKRQRFGLKKLEPRLKSVGPRLGPR
jgi:DNA-binding PadR family transcriptional regulator